MNATQSTPSTPALQRLHEVTDRIRRRAAEQRAREAERAGRWSSRRSRFGQEELPLRLAPVPPLHAQAVPHHWSDGPDDEKSAA